MSKQEILKQLDAIQESLKHLPGRHDQQSHTPKTYGNESAQGGRQGDTGARDVVPADVVEQKADVPAPKAANPSPPSGLNASLSDAMDYNAFNRATDKGAYTKKIALEVANSLGVDTKVNIMDDADFNALYKNAKMSAEGKAFGGINAITAGYKSDINTIALRRSKVEAIHTEEDYRQFRLAMYHEMGHAYHATKLGIKIQDKGVYGAGWCEGFAESVAAQLGWSERMLQSKSNPQSRFYTKAQGYDPVSAFDEMVRNSMPSK